MKQLILHDMTRGQLEQFISRPTHALLLTAPNGMGKTSVAEAVAAKLLGATPASHPYHLTIQPEGASISIEAIRSLQKFLQLRTTGDRPFRRTVIIEYAHTLTTEAQNAFLKLLEEPPADTLIILTANSPRGLLPTILSRVQSIALVRPDETQLQPLLAASQKDEQAQKQAYFLSGGLPGLLHALLYDDEHPLVASIATAKEVLQKTPFERLALVDGLSKQKEAASGVVDALERIAQAGLNGAGAKQDLSRIKQWQQVRKASLDARAALQRSANAKLVLSHLFLTIH